MIFEYGTGLHNIRRMRWNEDMSQVTNKLWYYGGPRVGTTQDPAGDQHWCWNVNGTGPCFIGAATAADDDLPLADATEMKAQFAVLDACRDESQTDFGVRMDIKIWDALGTSVSARTKPTSSTPCTGGCG